MFQGEVPGWGGGGGGGGYLGFQVAGMARIKTQKVPRASNKTKKNPCTKN